MRVLLTGSAGFIGSAIDRALTARGDDIVRVDLMLPDAHGAVEPARRARTASTSATRRPGTTCSRASTRSATRPPWSGWASAWPTCRRTPRTTTSVRRRCWPPCTSAGVARLVLASSMVVYGEGRYVCPDHGAQSPGARSEADLEAGGFENPCPVCGGPLDWDLVDEDARLDPRSGYAASKVAQEHYAAAWARQAGGAVVALRYHNVYGPGMPRDTPYSGRRGDVPLGGRARRGAAGLRGRRADARLRPRRRRGPGQRAGARRRRRAPSAAWRPYNVCSGHAGLDPATSRGPWPATGRRPTVTGEYRLGDVRHIVASPERAARRPGVHAPRSRPAEGLARFATRPAALTLTHQLVRTRCCTSSADDDLEPEHRPPPSRGQAGGRQQQPRARTAARSARPRPCSSATRPRARSAGAADATSSRTTRGDRRPRGDQRAEPGARAPVRQRWRRAARSPQIQYAAGRPAAIPAQ